MFKQMDLKGKVKDDTKLDTVHQNTITKIRVYEGSPGRVTKFSSESYQNSAIMTNHCSERRGWTCRHLDSLDGIREGNVVNQNIKQVQPQ